MAIFNPPSAQKYVGVFVLFVEFFLPVFFMIIAYTKIIIHLMSVQTKKPQATKKVKFSKDLKVFNVENDAQRQDNNEPRESVKESKVNDIRENTFNRAQKNLTKTLLYVCGAFIICWTGNEVYVLLHYVWHPFTWTEWYYYVSVLAVSANGCINPYIYCLQYDEARDNLRRIICCKEMKEDAESSTSVVQNSI